MNVGDIVVLTRESSGWVPGIDGKPGVVRWIGGSQMAVEFCFDVPSGHDCGGKTATGRGRYSNTSHARLYCPCWAARK